MSTKHTVLLAALIPGLALLTACNRNVDDTNPTPTAETTPAPAATDTAPPEPTPTEPMPAETAPAAMPSTGSELAFADMDKNHDGGITKDELADSDTLYEHFSAADSDGDGKLSEAEVSKHRAEMSPD
jgi:hypothetical protein